MEDKNHHGPPSDALMPDSVNMRTTFITSGRKAQQGRTCATKLSIHVLPRWICRTLATRVGQHRTGYKTQQKLEAFNIMADLAIKLGIHDAVIEAAKEEFAKFREVKERVEKF